MRAPVVIGALGGSGTRVVARLVRRAGYFMGTDLNESEDAMEFVEFYDRWINRFLLRRPAPLISEEQMLMAGDFVECTARHLRQCPSPDARWGWKEPRSIYLLPFLDQIYPGMKFIHVVRDGRDIAFSSNQNQLRKHGTAVLSDADLKNAPQPARTAALWARVNLEAAAYGEKLTPKRYLCLRFETLCAEPEATVRNIFQFLENQEPDIQCALAEINPPPSVGRWQHFDDDVLIAAVCREATQALTRFGYV